MCMYILQNEENISYLDFNLCTHDLTKRRFTMLIHTDISVANELQIASAISTLAYCLSSLHVSLKVERLS